ncbi:hypothetical protein KY285_029653 [Solanum tuberosum]|nr:hypothetical protein KY285_029653 [Solanum tuberosum]
MFFFLDFVGMKKKQIQQKKQMPKRMKKKQIQKKHFMKKHFTKRMKKKKTQKKMKKKRIQKKQILKRMKKKSKEDENDISRKPCYLLFLVVLVELEMQKIILGELKTSKFAQSRTFKDKILPKGFSYHLCNLLEYLRNEKLKKLPTNVTARNIDVAIEFLLVFLGDVPNHVINGKGLNEVLANIGVLVGDILCVIQMLLAESTIKEDSSKIDLDTMQILEKIEDLKAQVEERYKSLKYSPSNYEFPAVGGLNFLDSLLRKLNEMLKSESKKELSSLTSVFRDVEKVQHKHDEILKDLQRRAVNLAYEAEVSIDSILVKYNALWHSFCSLPAIIEEINHINVEVTKMGSVNLALRPFSVVEPSKHLPPQHSNVMNDEDDIVGFEDDTKIIIQHLIRGTSELAVIPIVGMGGKELLQDIFSQVTGSKGEKDDVLAEMLKKKLTVKRYLIVLDDMWDGKAWDDLRLCFPDVGNRSRIVLTTRLEEVAKQAKHHTDPYYLPFLKPDESLKLLQKKVFQQEGCPPELQDVSQAVAERCKRNYQKEENGTLLVG